MASQRTKEEADKLAVEHLHLVPAVFEKEFVRKAGQWIRRHRDDFVSEGNIALLAAGKGWNENKGSFVTYAYTCIYRRMVSKALPQVHVMTLPRRSWHKTGRGVRDIKRLHTSRTRAYARDLTEQADHVDQVETLLARLRKKARAMVRAVWLEGRKLADVAAEFKVSTTRVCVVVGDALDFLREMVRSKANER